MTSGLAVRVRPVRVRVVPQAGSAPEPSDGAFAGRVQGFLAYEALVVFAEAVVDEGAPGRSVGSDADVDEVLHAAAAVAADDQFGEAGAEGLGRGEHDGRGPRLAVVLGVCEVGQVVGGDEGVVDRAV